MLSRVGQSRGVPWCMENSTAAVSRCLEQVRTDVQCYPKQSRAGVYNGVWRIVQQLYHAVWSRSEQMYNAV